MPENSNRDHELLLAYRAALGIMDDTERDKVLRRVEIVCDGGAILRTRIVEDLRNTQTLRTLRPLLLKDKKESVAEI